MLSNCRGHNLQGQALPGLQWRRSGSYPWPQRSLLRRKEDAGACKQQDGEGGRENAGSGRWFVRAKRKLAKGHPKVLNFSDCHTADARNEQDPPHHTYTHTRAHARTHTHTHTHTHARALTRTRGLALVALAALMHAVHRIPAAASPRGRLSPHLYVWRVGRPPAHEKMV